MDDRQKEHGYIEIANAIWEDLMAAPFNNASQIKIVMAIIRETYGQCERENGQIKRDADGTPIKKKQNSIAISQICAYTGLSRPTVCKELQRLVEWNVLTKVSRPYKPAIYSYQKYPDKWQIEKYDTRSDSLTSKANLTSKDSLTTTSKANLTRSSKANLTHQRKKENRKKTSYSQAAKDITNTLKARLKEREVYMERNWHLKGYAVADSLLKAVKAETLINCIEWALNDEFWCDKITSMASIKSALPKYQLRRDKHGNKTSSDTDWENQPDTL